MVALNGIIRAMFNLTRTFLGMHSLINVYRHVVVVIVGDVLDHLSTPASVILIYSGACTRVVPLLFSIVWPSQLMVVCGGLSMASRSQYQGLALIF